MNLRIFCICDSECRSMIDLIDTINTVICCVHLSLLIQIHYNDYVSLFSHQVCLTPDSVKIHFFSDMALIRF